MKKSIFTLFLFAVLSMSVFAQNSSKSTREAAEFLNRGDIPGAIAVLDKAVAHKKDLFEVYKMRSFLRPMIGDFSGALDDLSSAIEIKSDEGKLYESRAWLRLRMRQDSSLILKDLDLAIANGRKLEKIYTMRASILRQKGDAEGAIADYQTALGLRPDLAQAHVGLASIYSIGGDENKAASILESFLEAYENSLLKAPNVKGKIIAQSSVQLLPEKKRDTTESVQTIVITRDEPRRMPSSPAEAAAMTDQLEQTKNTALAYTNLASIYEKRGEYEKALKTVEKGVALDDTDTYAVSTRVKIKAALKYYDGALKDFNAAIEKAPAMPYPYLERGITLFILGREAEAQKDFDKYLQIFPQGKTFLEKRLAAIPKRN